MNRYIIAALLAAIPLAAQAQYQAPVHPYSGGGGPVASPRPPPALRGGDQPGGADAAAAQADGRPSLDEFAAKLDACETLEEVEAAVLCEEACRASKTFTGEARTRLKALIAAALALHKPFGN